MKKTLGSHPGAINFRFSVMVILILIFIVYFFFYFEDAKKEIERASILQTKKIIDSSLAVVFATYAVKGKLDDLQELDGANPFVFMAKYKLVPPAYQGEIDSEPSSVLAPGWYYLARSRSVVYKSRYIDTDSYFAIVLKYQDLNQSGRFEAAADKYQSLQFVRISRL